MKRTLFYYWRTTKKQFPMFVVSVAVTIGYVFFLSYALPFVIGLLVDRIAAGGVAPDEVFSVYGGLIAVFILFTILGQICSKLQDYATWKIEIAGKYDLDKLVFETLCKQSMTFHVNRYGGSLVSQTTKFVDSYERAFELLTYNLIPIGTTGLFTVGFSLYVNVWFGLIMLVLIIGFCIVAWIMYKRVLRLNTKSAGAQNDLSGELSDSVTNILTVKTYGREAYEHKLFDQANDSVRTAEGKRMRASMERGVITTSVLVVIMIAFTIFASGANSWFGISAGTVVVMFNYVWNVSTQFNRINMTLQGLNIAFGSAHDMTLILDEPTLVDDVDGAPDLVVNNGDIEFKNVSFNYAESAIQTDVFENFNLHIPAGQRIGLVGKSGSGKTTLTFLLLRLADLQHGSITIDGQDISQCAQISLRHQIAYVPQEPMLFHRSIAENISYGKPDATLQEIRAAARRANADEFIMALPYGYDTETGERGVKLSGGQRQRIAIARAILADAPILVLDEATSALDSESEKAVQDALKNLMQGRTCIIVAHRLSTVASLDRIVVIREGRIVEDGKHADLLARGGEYASLWDLQTGAFLDV